MKQPEQCFSIAHLIFIKDESTLAISDDELKQIESRFLEVLNSFTTNETYYTTNMIHKGGTKLPYNTFFSFGAPSCNLFLHFAISYGEPLLFIYDRVSRKVKNHINIQQVKLILDDNFYENFRLQVHFPRVTNKVIPNVADLTKFIDLIYKKELELHESADCVTGAECFEIKL